MASRSRYRKWYKENGVGFIRVDPDGTMHEISFELHALIGEVVKIVKTKKLRTELFLNSKEVCRREDWQKAQKRAVSLVKGDPVGKMRL